VGLIVSLSVLEWGVEGWEEKAVVRNTHIITDVRFVVAGGDWHAATSASRDRGSLVWPSGIGDEGSHEPVHLGRLVQSTTSVVDRGGSVVLSDQKTDRCIKTGGGSRGQHLDC